MSKMRDQLMSEIEEWLYGEQISTPEPTEDHSVVHDTFDELTWEMLKGSSKQIKRVDDEFDQFFETGTQALEDLFNILYQSDPRMTGLSEMLPEFTGNHHILQGFTESEEVADLRKLTYLDDFQSGFAVLAMKDALYEALSKMEEKRQATQAARDALQEATDRLQQDGLTDEQLQAALDAAKAAQDAHQGALDDEVTCGGQITVDLAFTTQKVADEITDTTQAMQSYGFGPGELRQMDFDSRKHLSERLRNGRFRMLAKWIGQWKAVARAQRRKKVKHLPGETYDYELGNDLDRIVESELTELVVEDLEDLWFLKFAQGELLQRITRGEEKAGQGPILVVCDESQSMSSQLDALGHTREMWSKAVSIALAEQARKQQRDFTYIGFTTKVCYEATFEKGKMPLNRLVEFVEHFGNGGTAFEPPLARALEIMVRTEHEGQERPDIVFVTDGDASLDPRFVEKFRSTLRRLDGACYAIQIGGEAHGKVLRQLTEKVIKIDRLNASPEGVAELFKTI